MFLLRRKDVSTAPQAFAYRVPKDFWKTDSPVEYPEDFINLGLLARIGTVVGSKKYAATDLDMEQAKAQKPLANAQLEALRLELKKTGIARSITGEIVMDSKANTFTVAAPRTECAFLTAGALKAGRLSVAKANTPQSMLPRLVIAFLPRSKHLLISWLQSPFPVILQPKKIKSDTVSTVSPSICQEVMRPDAMIFVF